MHCGQLAPPKRATCAHAAAVRLAVVVPAHDEELMIARTVQSLLAAGCSATISHPAGETDFDSWEIPLFVVAHNCSDATAADGGAAPARE